MFQPPAWVESASNEGPTTIKSGLALGKRGAWTGRANGTPLLAAAVTALIVVVVGVAVLMLARRGDADSDAVSGPRTARRRVLRWSRPPRASPALEALSPPR